MQRTYVILGFVWLSLVAPPTLDAAQDPDGGDGEFERIFHVELDLGAGWPIAAANTEFDPSFIAGGKVSMLVTPTLRGGAELSFHSFDAERPGTADNQGVVSLNLFGKLVGVWGPYRPFALLGLGVVNSKRSDATRRWDPGLQFGGGMEAPLSQHVSILVGSALHTVPRGEEETELLWISGYLGVVFRQP